MRALPGFGHVHGCITWAEQLHDVSGRKQYSGVLNRVRRATNVMHSNESRMTGRNGSDGDPAITGVPEVRIALANGLHRFRVSLYVGGARTWRVGTLC
jgi:hypothetical protein